MRAIWIAMTLALTSGVGGVLPAYATPVAQGSILVGKRLDYTLAPNAVLFQTLCSEGIDPHYEPAIHKDNALSTSFAPIPSSARGTWKQLTIALAVGFPGDGYFGQGVGFVFWDSKCNEIGFWTNYATSFPAINPTIVAKVFVPTVASWIRVSGSYYAYAHLTWELA